MVQVESSYIILTGFRALNSVLGSNVYSSHQQLGGPQIMAKNGVSHLTVSDDFTGVRTILQWLSYIPPKKLDLGRHIFKSQDPSNRPVTVEIKSKLYDSREILAGGADTLGILDRGSLLELQPDWARTVFVGRGRLGGIPIGIISAETRQVQLEIPADPADRDSQEKIVQQAGQVWFPDSAFKTSQAIRDINHEGLPLLILANWRGFSGGMKDMYDQILKFGAMIVDALSKYTAGPVLVYIPPQGELRGGAWAVLDPAINPSKMEIYADPESRSSVLEPEGTVQIKMKNLSQLMDRLDTEINQLETSDVTDETQQAINERRNQLRDQYHSLALEFAELHDRPEATHQRGCLNGVVELRNSRKFLYNRLRRLLLQHKATELIDKSCEKSDKSSVAILERVFIQEHGLSGIRWEDDKHVTDWLEEQLSSDNSHVAHLIKRYENAKIIKELTSLAENQEADEIADIMQTILDSCSKQKQEIIMSILNNSN